MVGRALKTIDRVVTPVGTSTNIVSVSEEFVMQNDPRFVPNTYEGISMKFDHEWREIIITLDSDTDIFDTYIDDDGPNLPIQSFRIDFTMVIIATQTEITERWTYPANQVYVMDRREGRIEEGDERHTFEYHFLAYGNKTVSFI